MSATYTNQPGVRDIDTVRYEIDDRDTIPESDAKLSDEEIQYLIDGNRHILLAAAAAAETIAATYASEPVSKTVGDLKIDYGEGGIAGHYKTTAKALRLRVYRRAGANVYAGGTSHDDKDTLFDDADRVQPSFTVGMNDHANSATNTDSGVMDF